MPSWLNKKPPAPVDVSDAVYVCAVVQKREGYTYNFPKINYLSLFSQVVITPALTTYEWQRKPIFKAVLLARQEELRKADLRGKLMQTKSRA